MAKFHVIALTEAQREFLHRTMSAGSALARVTTRARVLLKADTGSVGPGWGDATIAAAVEVSIPTIERRTPSSATGWRMCSMSTPDRMTSATLRSASARPPSNSWPISRSRCPWDRSDRSERITSTSARACGTCFSGTSRSRADYAERRGDCQGHWPLRSRTTSTSTFRSSTLTSSSHTGGRHRRMTSRPNPIPHRRSPFLVT